MNNRVVVLDVCPKEIRRFPAELQRDILALVEQLNAEVKFKMPL